MFLSFYVKFKNVRNTQHCSINTIHVQCTWSGNIKFITYICQTLFSTIFQSVLEETDVPRELDLRPAQSRNIFVSY